MTAGWLSAHRPLHLSLAAQHNDSESFEPEVGIDEPKTRMAECGVYPCNEKGCALPLVSNFSCH